MCTHRLTDGRLVGGRGILGRYAHVANIGRNQLDNSHRARLHPQLPFLWVAAVHNLEGLDCKVAIDVALVVEPLLSKQRSFTCNAVAGNHPPNLRRGLEVDLHRVVRCTHGQGLATSQAGRCGCPTHVRRNVGRDEVDLERDSLVHVLVQNGDVNVARVSVLDAPGLPRIKREIMTRRTLVQ